MVDPCPHCGAAPSGTLMGFPIVKHEQGCPRAPSFHLKAADITKMVASLPPPKRFVCLGCGVEWDEPGEATNLHPISCPFHPLRN